MAPIVAPGIARFSLQGTIFDRTWANIFDMHIESGGIGGRDDNVRDQAKIFLNEWIDHVRLVIGNSVTLQRCRWVDLDSLDGTTGEVTAADSPRVMPSPGSVSSEQLPAASAVLVRKLATGGRAARNGRTYWPGVPEASTTGNSLTGTAVTSWNTQLALFLSGVSQSGASSFGGYDSHMVVVHTLAGIFTDHTDVTSLALDSRLATQRRRLRG